jgi:hypothetical protein
MHAAQSGENVIVVQLNMIMNMIVMMIIGMLMTTIMGLTWTMAGTPSWTLQMSEIQETMLKMANKKSWHMRQGRGHGGSNESKNANGTLTGNGGRICMGEYGTLKGTPRCIWESRLISNCFLLL